MASEKETKREKVLRLLIRSGLWAIRKENTKTLSIMVLSAIILMMKFCGNSSQVPVLVSQEIIHDTIPGDSIPYLVTGEIPDPIKIIVPTTDTLWKNVDTAAILQDYFSTLYYQDTLLNDTSALIVVNDTISQNEIQGRSLLFQNKRPIALTTTINNTYATPNTRLLSAGIIGGGNRSMFNFGVGILYTNKQRQSLSASMLLGNKQPTYLIGAYWPILPKGDKP